MSETTGHMYELVSDTRRRMLRVNLIGYWDLEIMSRYEAEVRQALRAFQNRGGYRYYLIDTSRFHIQPKEVADRHEALLSAAASEPGSKVAMLLPQDRSKLQAARVATVSGPQVFTDEAEALAWLFAA